MKKRLVMILLSAVAALCCAFAFGACSADNKPDNKTHEHKWSTAWDSDDTHHWHNCTESGCDVTDNSQKDGYGAHDFSDGNCVCGKPHEHVWAKTWTVGETTHYYACIWDGCTEKGSETAHDFTNGDCVCGKPHEHVWSKTWTVGETTHYYACIWDGCTSRLSEAAHDFSDGDCVCGKPHEHVWATDWTVGETTHYHACVWGECDGKSDETTHDFTNGNCVCGKLHEHVWATDWTVGETTHYHACVWNECDGKSDETAHDFTSGDCICGKKPSLSYRLSEDKKSFICTGLGNVKDTDIVIESSFKDENGEIKPVTSIGNSAFEKCNELTSVIIPDSVISIGSYAFRGCSSLTGITIPDSVTSIGWRACENCSGLTSITIPFVGETKNSGNFGYIFGASSDSENYKYIPSSLKTVVITGSTRIDSSAFYQCSNLTSISIPDSVTSIGSNAFYGCSGLKSITIPDSVTSIGWRACENCSGLTSITIPFVGDKKGYTNNTHFGYIFGSDSYNENSENVPSNLKTVVITGGTSIGRYAFYGCNRLTSIAIPDSVTSIGENAFKGCSELTNINYTGGIEGWCAIYGLSYLMTCNMYAKTLYIDGERTTRELIIPESVTSISEDAFWGTAWYDNQPDGLVYAGKVAYEYKGTMPDNTSIILKEGTKAIAEKAFFRCSKLKSITIPDSVTSIGGYAFSYCDYLTNINYTGDIASWCAISGLDSLMVNGIADKALYIDGKKIMGELTIPDSVTSISSYAFYNCGKLTSVTIPDSVTYIGKNAFYNSAWYNNQPDGLVYAGKVAYKYKGTMPDNTSITLKDGTKGIADSAFYNCGKLTSITIPDSVTSIGYQAFYGCNELRSITIGNSVTSIGYQAFAYCSGLTEITFDGTTEQWKNIEKSNYWNNNSGDYIVHCTDGDLSKSESAS